MENINVMKDFEVTFKRIVYLKTTVKAKDMDTAEEKAYKDYDNGYCHETESHLVMEEINEL